MFLGRKQLDPEYIAQCSNFQSTLGENSLLPGEFLEEDLLLPQGQKTLKVSAKVLLSAGWRGSLLRREQQIHSVPGTFKLWVLNHSSAPKKNATELLHRALFCEGCLNNRGEIPDPGIRFGVASFSYNTNTVGPQKATQWPPVEVRPTYTKPCTSLLGNCKTKSETMQPASPPYQHSQQPPCTKK